MRLKSKKLLVFSLLFFVFILAISSSLGDSATSDEPPHIVAGYSYLKFHDMRLNPEHPPLAKSLAAFPLLFFKFKFSKIRFCLATA